MNLYKLFIYLNDLREDNKRLHFLKSIKKVMEDNAENIQKYQLTRLKEIIAYSYNNTEFYRNRFKEADVTPDNIESLDDLAKIPFLEKDDVRNKLTSMLSKNIDKNDMVKAATGGTTSSPVTFFIDKKSLAKRRAATLFFLKWFNYEIGDKMAYLWGAEQDFPTTTSFKTKTRNLLVDRVLYLQASFLNNETMWSHYEKLVKFKPKVLQASPTALFIFARFLEQNNLKLDIKNIHITSEYLYDYQREKIEKVFNIKVFNWYGARELGHIASECSEHQGMHINTSGLFIEVIKNGKSVVNEEGELVVTDLLNQATPLLRYKTNDIGMISTRRCRCGSALPLLETISGRYADAFKKRDGSFIPGVELAGSIIKDCKEIEELQIIQKDYELLHFNIVKGKQYSSNALENLKGKISFFMHDDSIKFEVDFVDKIPAEKSGKFRFFKSEIE